MSLFKNRDSALTILVDIGSGSLTVSMVHYERNSPPVFLYTLSRDFTAVDKPNSYKLISNVIKNFEDALPEVVKKGFAHSKTKNLSKELSSVVISLSSPWFLPKNKYIEINKDKAFIIDESFIKSITDKEADVFREEIIKDGGKEESFEVVESSVVHIKVNGYVLNKIMGQKTKEMSAYLCLSLVEKSLLDKLREVINKHTHIDKEKVVFRTFPLISFTVFRDLFTQFQDFIIMDVTSEITDITLVQNDIMVKTVSVPSGRSFIIRQIAKDFSVTPEIAESNLSLYSYQKLDNETSAKVESVLVDVEKEWSIYIEKAFLEVSPELNLPLQLYLTSERDVSDLYMSYLKLPKADATAEFRKKVNIVKIEDKIFDGLYKNESHTIPNEFVCLLAIFYNKFVFK